MVAPVEADGVQHIDTHIHFLPDAYRAAVEKAGGDPSGFPTPAWSLPAHLDFSSRIGADFSILSVTAPGPSIAGEGEEARKLAREINVTAAEYAEQPDAKGKVGFFASLPSFNDEAGCLEEIDFVFNQQKKAFGVVIMTSYGDKLIGDPAFRPIWDALNKRKALVFIHPTSYDITPKFINGRVPQPVIDYPYATARAAISLLYSGTLDQSPDVDIILSHAGGVLPFIGGRAVDTLLIPPIAQRFAEYGVDHASMGAAWSRFYYDIALSVSRAQLLGLTAVAQPDRILYGSDFPYCPDYIIQDYMGQWKDFVAKEGEGKSPEQLAKLPTPAKLRANGIALLKRHAPQLAPLPFDK